MVARNRPHHVTLGVADTLQEHMRLVAEHKDLMQEVAELRDAGKIGEARRLFKKTEAMHAQIRAIEERMRVRGPGD